VKNNNIELSEVQQSIVHSKADRILVHAVAGSGKTTVLVERIKQYLRDGINPSKMLVFTFTNKMSRELESRLKGFKKIQHVGTFHSYCLNLLKKNLDIIKYKDIAIISETEKQEIYNSIANENFLRFPSKKYLQREIQKYYTEIPNIKDMDIDLGVFIKLYLAFMRKNCFMDYDLLEHYAIPIAKKESGKIECVVVDEYQDTSLMEAGMIEAFNVKKVFVVGDVFQSIYEWRGATVKNIQSFKADEIWEIDQTFRCSEPICDIANKLIHYNEIGYEMDIKSLLAGSPVDVISTTLEETIETIRRVLVKYLNLYSPGDVFILCRTNKQVNEIASNLKDYPLSDVKSERIIMKYMEYFVYLCRMHVGFYTNYNTDRVLSSLKIESPDTLLSWNIKARQQKKKLYHIAGEKSELFNQFLHIIRNDRGLAEKARMFFGLLGFPFGDGIYVDEAIDLIKCYEDINGPDLSKFVDWFIDKQEDGDSVTIEDKKITVMTVHQAKGLERPLIIIPYIDDNSFPNPRSDLQEELRLMYVACTRAKQKLILIKTGNSIFFPD